MTDEESEMEARSSHIKRPGVTGPTGEKRLCSITWWAVLLMVLAANSDAFELNPVCHRYYEQFQMPNLTYEDVGRIADRMHESNCWPAMQGLLPATESTLDSNRVPSCEFLAQELVGTSDNVLKLFEVRPMVKSDCGEVNKRCSDPGYLAATDFRGSSIYSDSVNAKEKREWISRRRKECTRSTTDVPSNLWNDDVALRLPQCDLLVDDPLQLSKQIPQLGFRPVNCRGKIVYSDGNKAGLYFYMEHYSDGDSAVWGANIGAWGW